MARRGNDAGVEECKGYSPPNDHTTSASSTPLPFGSWDLNTSTRPMVSEARMARNRARYAQRTGRQRLHDARQKRMARGASPAVGECGGVSVINSAAQRLENKVLLIHKIYIVQKQYFLQAGEKKHQVSTSVVLGSMRLCHSAWVS